MANTYDLAGKRILLTGANGRLGGAYLVALLESGAFVYAADLHDKLDAQVEDELAARNFSAYAYLSLDITSEESLRAAEASLEEPLDAIINNAGAKGIKGKFEDRTVEDIDRVLAVHLKGTILCTRVFSKKMIEQKSGTILNVASIYGMVAPDKGIYDDPSKINSEVYGATKAGIIQFTKYLAAYLGEYGITANCVSPGGVHNESQHPSFVAKYSAKVPLGRMANPEDLTDLVCFLCSDGARYITGQNIAVDGGLTAL